MGKADTSVCLKHGCWAVPSFYHPVWCCPWELHPCPTSGWRSAFVFPVCQVFLSLGWGIISSSLCGSNPEISISVYQCDWWLSMLRHLRLPGVNTIQLFPRMLLWKVCGSVNFNKRTSPCNCHQIKIEGVSRILKSFFFHLKSSWELTSETIGQICLVWDYRNHIVVIFVWHFLSSSGPAIVVVTLTTLSFVLWDAALARFVFSLPGNVL